MQDYVDTVRAVVFMNETICKTFCAHREPPTENARGSERIEFFPGTAGVRAEHLAVNEYFIHKIAHSLFIKPIELTVSFDNSFRSWLVSFHEREKRNQP